MVRLNAFYEKSCPYMPSMLHGTFNEALRAYRCENFRESLEKFEEIVEFYSSLRVKLSHDFIIVLSHNCGLLHQELENYGRAQRYYENALEIKNNLPTFLAYATLKEAQGREEDARHDYYRYTRRACAGELLVQGGVFGDAQEASGRGAGANNLGIMHYDKKEYAAALLCFDWAKKLDPGEGAYYCNSAQVLFDQGDDYKTIREHLNIAIMNGFARAPQYLQRGICLFFEKSYIEAQDDFRRALKLEPGNKNAQKMLDNVNRVLGELTSARARAA